MAQRIGSDAERLTAIQHLERAIQEKLPALNAARTARDSAKQVETARRHDLTAIDQEIGAIGREIHLQSAGVYLNGESLDRGTVSLGNEVMWFSGWQGKAEIPIHTIARSRNWAFSLGSTSRRPCPGEALARHASSERDTTAYRAGSDAHSAQHAVVADLQNVEEWQKQIHRRQHELDAVHLRRDDLAAQREKATAALRQASTTLAAARAELSQVESEIGEFHRQSDRLRAQQRQIDAARAQAARATRQTARRRRRK